MSVMELQGQGRDGERELALGRCQLEFSFRLIAILWKKAYPACRISGLLLDETFSRKCCRAFPVKPRRLSRRGKKHRRDAAVIDLRGRTPGAGVEL